MTTPTLDQVRELLDKVAKHPRLGNKAVKKCLGNYRLPVAGEHNVSDLDHAVGPPDMAAKTLANRLNRVFQEAENLLKAQPSEKDEELIGKIDAAVKAEDKAASVVTERGVELGKQVATGFVVIEMG